MTDYIVVAVVYTYGQVHRDLKHQILPWEAADIELYPGPDPIKNVSLEFGFMLYLTYQRN